jgi:poly-gamma-glutamate capsule biosynthesis protein CapA/YwtB (metallophosphatase superfamily)
MFHIHALRNIYTYVPNQQGTLIIYALSYINSHQQVSLIAQNAEVKSLYVKFNISSVPCGHEMSDYVVVTNR